MDKVYAVQVKAEDVITLKIVLSKQKDEKIEWIKEQAEKNNYSGIMLQYPLAYILFDDEFDRDNFFDILKVRVNGIKIDLDAVEITDKTHFDA